MATKKLKCDYEGCNKSYGSSFNLKRHIESSHFGMRKFKCSICRKILSSKQNLIDHQNIHTGAKPYVCEISDCNQHFRQLSQYYLHKQLHAEVSSQLRKDNCVVELSLQLLVKKLSQAYNTEEYNTINLPCEVLHLPLISPYLQDTKLPLHPVLNQVQSS
ncbi:hypothetical protein SteCoe_23669 [Stentor coeruleus]|uniref:C2H2-type domain-containing protein n=1 Tax=Stentor coeruleus TaxID=5963 RepID=A0A1R2BJB2_9CILI|nr:hypothetical protein SteCoe_23669 [Stentor coeruleus]